MIAMKQAAVKTIHGIRLYDTGDVALGMPVLTPRPEEARAYDDGKIPPAGFAVEPVMYRVSRSLVAAQ